MRHLKTLASALAIVLIVLMATDYIAMAATGKPLILGHVNKSGKTTTIKSTKGVALSLKTKSSQPPLKVNSGKVVKNLNADKLDGKSANQIGVNPRIYSKSINVTSSTIMQVTTATVPAGKYLVGISAPLTVANLGPAPNCYAFSAVSAKILAQERLPTASNTETTLNMTGYVSLSTSERVILTCEGLNAAPGMIQSDPNRPMIITLTPADKATSGSLT